MRRDAHLMVVGSDVLEPKTVRLCDVNSVLCTHFFVSIGIDAVDCKTKHSHCN